MIERPKLKIAPVDAPSDMNIEERLVFLNDQVLALTTTATTSPLPSVPVPQITQGLTSNGTGVQFTFNQLTIGGIDGYRVYRNTSNSFASASQIQYVKQSVSTTTSVVITDTTPANTTYYYWVTAVSAAGLESAPVSAQAAGVTSGSVVDSAGLVGSGKVYPGIQLNATNFAAVDSVDAGSSATVRIYGASGGVGTSWTRKVGSTTEGPFPSGNVTGLSYNTHYNIMYDGTQFYAYTDLPSTLPDNLKYVGSLTTVPSSGGATATATALLNGTGVNSVTVNNGGTGYTSAPTVALTGGGGTGATATATIASGVVTSVTITNAGTGYTSAPTVAFSGGGGSGAAGTAVLVGTSVAQVSVTNGGSGYTTAPTVQLNGGGGSGATAYATVSAGAVLSVTITNSGSGYTSAPSVAFVGGQSGTVGGGGTAGTAGGARYNIEL